MIWRRTFWLHYKGGPSYSDEIPRMGKVCHRDTATVDNRWPALR